MRTDPQAINHGVAVVKAKVVQAVELEWLAIQANDLAVAGGQGARGLDGPTAGWRWWGGRSNSHAAVLAIQAGTARQPSPVADLYS